MAEIGAGSGNRDARLAAPVLITGEHDVSDFDCGEPALNNWLRHRALRNEGRFSRTYVVCTGNKVAAYFCISTGAVARSDAPKTLQRNAPETIPVAIIGRLAVSREHAGRGLGADILSDALRRIAVTSQSIGMRAVLVHAKDDNAKAFYMACAEFIEYPAESRTLFLPIETLIGAFT